MTAVSRLGAILALLWLWLLPAAWAEVAIPALEARVTDLTGTLSAEQRGVLEGRLGEIEARTGSQMAVLLVPTTQPETIEQYAIRVAEAWQLGQRGVDNGVLLLVAKNDRKVRIEVGYGLEGAIPDASAKRVIAEDIAPRFKVGDFAGGLGEGIRQLAELVDAESAAAGKASRVSAAPDDGSVALQPSAPYPVEKSFGDSLADEIREVPIWLLVLIMAVGTALRWVLGPLFGGLATGGLVGAGAWFVSGAVEVAVFAAIMAFVFVLVGMANWIGIATSGGSSGSSGGSGGFSGGGGSFGGGGASGSW